MPFVDVYYCCAVFLSDENNDVKVWGRCGRLLLDCCGWVVFLDSPYLLIC